MFPRIAASLVLAVATVAVSAEPTKTSTQDTPYFTIDLPTDWTMTAQVPKDEESKEREFNVSNAHGTYVFTVTAAIDGPRFIPCFCVPMQKYKRYEKAGLKYADVFLDDVIDVPELKVNVRTLKIVGQHYGTDVHLDYRKGDKSELDKIVESIHPK